MRLFIMKNMEAKIKMIYTVKRIDEDLDYGCEERTGPVMAIVVLEDADGVEHMMKMEDDLLYQREINVGDKVIVDENGKCVRK